MLIKNNVSMHIDLKKLPSSHYLMDLSTTQWKRHIKNTILFQGLSEEKVSKNNTTISYNSIVYGSNIKAKKKRYHMVKGTVHCNTLLLKNITGGYIFIVARRSELEQHNDSIIILDGSA